MKNQFYTVFLFLFGTLYVNAQTSIPLRVNVGGDQETYEGNVFISDQYYDGGTAKSYSNTTIDAPFRSERYGNFSYNIPVANGYYDIALHFMENHFNGPSLRIFDVKIENNLVMDNYDIYQEVGKNNPSIKFFKNIQVNDGILNLVFTTNGSGGEVNNAKLSAFEILTPQDPTGWSFINDDIYYNIGNVGIGTTSPDEKLSVNGKIHTKEVKVDLIGWSDFVFAKDYDLPTLKEVEQHIKEKGHLKDIPSAKEVEENGILLGDMNAKLLQKIEELTLYAIEQEKKLESQETKIQEQTKNNTDLNNRLLKLEQLLTTQQQTTNNK